MHPVENNLTADAPALLLLVHRIPFPPNKGDKIRSYHLLKHLSQHYRVFLATFIDDEQDIAYQDEVKAFCADTLFIKIDPRWRKIVSLRGLLTSQPLTLPFYASAEMQEWVDNMVKKNNIDHAIAFSSAMAMFLMHERFNHMRRIMDFIDIDSDKWAQYSKQKSWPLNYIYRREAHYLLRFERKVAKEFDASVFVSSHEAELFKQLSPSDSHSISAIYNGVDSELFSLDHRFDSPLKKTSAGVVNVVFVGAMDYWPNIDAAVWFAEKVFPLLTGSHAVFHIVGSSPSKRVQDLDNNKNIFVTGRVDDVRAYIQHADVCVAPLRIARGIQNKVLESLSMSKATVVTSLALEGIPAEDEEHLLVADSADGFAAAVLRLANDKQLSQELGLSGRALMEDSFSWEMNLDAFFSLLNAKDNI